MLEVDVVNTEGFQFIPSSYQKEYIHDILFCMNDSLADAMTEIEEYEGTGVPVDVLQETLTLLSGVYLLLCEKDYKNNLHAVSSILTLVSNKRECSTLAALIKLITAGRAHLRKDASALAALIKLITSHFENNPTFSTLNLDTLKWNENRKWEGKTMTLTQIVEEFNGSLSRIIQSFIVQH